MGKFKNLRGIPKILIDSFMKSIFYFHSDYMSTYLKKRMIAQGIDKVKIDILRGISIPEEFYSDVIERHKSKLIEIINNNLKAANFTTDYINSAKFIFSIDDDKLSFGKVFCQAFVDFSDGKIVEGSVEWQTYLLADSLLEKATNGFLPTQE